MNLFETLKDQVSVPQAADYYGLKIFPGNKVCCPFHRDKHPSMKLNPKYYYCFGCQAGGDVIALVANLFEISSYNAAKKLAYDFGIDANSTDRYAKPSEPHKSAYQQAKDNETRCQRVICDYLHLLEHWAVKYSPQNPDEEFHPHYVEYAQMYSHIEDLADKLTFSDAETRQKIAELLLADGTIEKLENYVKKYAKENRNHEQEI